MTCGNPKLQSVMTRWPPNNIKICWKPNKTSMQVFETFETNSWDPQPLLGSTRQNYPFLELIDVKVSLLNNNNIFKFCCVKSLVSKYPCKEWKLGSWRSHAIKDVMGHSKTAIFLCYPKFLPGDHSPRIYYCEDFSVCFSETSLCLRIIWKTAACSVGVARACRGLFMCIFVWLHTCMCITCIQCLQR